MSETSTPPLEPTPISWRLAIAAGIILLGGLAYMAQNAVGPRGQAFFGMFCLLGLVAMFSTNLRAVSRRTLLGGFALQWLLALFILKLEINGMETLGIPDHFCPGYAIFRAITGIFNKLIEFTARGSHFVFGPLANPGEMERVFGRERGFVFAFAALPVIVFVSAFFSVMYYLGVLQWVVSVFARVMAYLMGTSGAESLTSAANVFMGQTEAPLIIKPYIGKMTQSELFSMMVSGMAHISGGLLAVYMELGADPVSILATCVMAAPCGLYLSKLFMPETETPETRGVVKASPEQPHRNVIDAASAGASEGMSLAINIAAMLIAFLAFLAMIDYLLGCFPTDESLFELLSPVQGWLMLGNWLLTLFGYWLLCLCISQLRQQIHNPNVFSLKNKPLLLQTGIHLAGYGLFLLVLHGCMSATTEPLSLKLIFSRIFAPLAFLMGVNAEDVYSVANLLGTKLTLNEFVAYQEFKTEYINQGKLSKRSRILVTYALTGFANFSSIGIQLGGIGAMAPHRRPDLARFGLRALYVGFLATILNAAIAGILIEDEPS